MQKQHLQFRHATARDLHRIVELLADDPLGSKREVLSDPVARAYEIAFEAIDSDPNNELVVVEQFGKVIGVLQITFIPYLTHQGSWRALIEGVRVSSQARSAGVGQQLLSWAIRRARERNCQIVQLTTDKTRPDAIRFYEALGFKASHEGMKMQLAVSTTGAA